MARPSARKPKGRSTPGNATFRAAAVEEEAPEDVLTHDVLWGQNVHYFAAFCLEISNSQRTWRKSLEDALAFHPICLLVTLFLFLPHPPRASCAVLLSVGWESPRDPVTPESPSLQETRPLPQRAPCRAGPWTRTREAAVLPRWHVRLADLPQVLEAAATPACTQRPSHTPGHTQGHCGAPLVPTLHSGTLRWWPGIRHPGTVPWKLAHAAKRCFGSPCRPAGYSRPTRARAPRPPRREGCVRVTLWVPRP